MICIPVIVGIVGVVTIGSVLVAVVLPLVIVQKLHLPWLLSQGICQHLAINCLVIPFLDPLIVGHWTS